MPDSLQKKGNYTSIPLTKNIAGHFLVAINIRAIRTNFILDTGAGNTVIDKEFAEKNNLKIEATEMKGGGVGTDTLSIYKLRASSIRLSDFKVNNMILYAVNLQHVKDLLARKGITDLPEGVIGADILIKHNAIINYATATLFLN